MIDVAFTRAEIRPADIAVVIDVLRATSTATQALAAGYRRVMFADSIEAALSLRRPHRVLAGERNCVTPDGFDQGNSPLEAAQTHGLDLVLATTNGAPAVVMAAKRAPQVLLGCLLNLGAVIDALRSRVNSEAGNILLVCAGTDGAPAVEDVYVAGRLSTALDGPRSDAALIAEAVSRAYETAFEALNSSANAKVLRANGLSGDIAYCALTSELSCVPIAAAERANVAIATDSQATRLTAVSDATSGPPGSLTDSTVDDSDTVNV